MKNIYILFFLCLSSAAFSQEDAWVYFNAKPNSQTYFDTPLKMLSQRALDRRANQNIALDSKDVPLELSYITQIKAVSGVTVLAQSKWMNALHIRGSQSAINSLKTFPFVQKVDFANKTLNVTGRKASTARIYSTVETEDTQVNFAYGSSANQIEMLNGHLLHQQNYTGSGKIIAVLDGGFPGVNTALPFQKLRDNNQILGGYDYVARNSNFYTGSSHGAEVLSAMGGYKSNALVGTAPDASYYLFVTEDDTSENPVEESLWVEAAEKADSLGVDIINTSLGYFEYDNPAYSHTYSEMNGTTAFISRGAEIAFSRGMIVVTAAGNEGATDNPHIGAPADAVSVIAVGAVNSVKNLTSFSSIGPSFDGRIKPDVMAQGQAAVLSDPVGNIISANGTSFSSPIMSGMVACLWQAFPNFTNKQIRELILKSADRYTLPTAQYGYGIPDFSLSLANGLGLDHSAVADFVITPNPTTDFISVAFPENNLSAKVSLYALSGQKVEEKNITRLSPKISLKSLGSGVYLYKIESGGTLKSGKIIKL
jgi:subtilisin family serine protease